ncbi:hypothetical protein EW429_04075 [Salmonella enterica subsp. enterica serovar Oranienburg]|nr:hypothetical protein [Salmonella enterica subsp. enterica serovar Oranienburg]
MITMVKAESDRKSYAVSAKKVRSVKEGSVFRNVRGMGSVAYGKKAQRLINQRIAKYGSIRAYYEHVNGGRKSSTTEQK